MKKTIKSLLLFIIGSSLLFEMTPSYAQELESEAKSQEEIETELKSIGANFDIFIIKIISKNNL